MPVEPEALRYHIAERGSFLFHATTAAHREAILCDGLRPGSDLGRYVRDDFFRTRSGHVYLCDRRALPLVSVEGPRLTLEVDLRKLEPERFDTDEDVPRDCEIFRGEAWFDLKTPQLDLDADANTQAGRLADWAEAVDVFDAPEHAERSLAAGRVAHRGTIPPGALRAVELAGEPVELFRKESESMLGLGNIGRCPALAYWKTEAERVLTVASAVMKAGIALLDDSTLPCPERLDDLHRAHRLGDELHRWARLKNREGVWDLRDLALELAALAEAVREFDPPPIGWNSASATEVCRRAAGALSSLAQIGGHERARMLVATILDGLS